MIQQVGFKNFRRFESFPMMNLGDINIFVGRNNAGKSTVLKALQLIKGNLNNLSNISLYKNFSALSRPMFVFDVDELAELHIDNFERALYNKAERKEITLSATIDGWEFTFVLDGQNIRQDSFYVAVPYNFIELKKGDFHLTFNYDTRDLYLKIKSERNSRYEDEISMLREKQTEFIAKEKEASDEFQKLSNKLKEATANSISTEQIAKIVDQIQRFEGMQKYYARELKHIDTVINEIEEKILSNFHVEIHNLPEFVDQIRTNVIDQLFHNIYEYANMPTADRRTAEGKLAEKNKKFILDSTRELRENEKEIESVVAKFNVEYIHAHAASQKVIYLKEDKNDTLSKALSEFCKARINEGETEWNFIKTWMRDLEIGSDFRIKDVDSAGYMIRIFDEGEDSTTGKGMNLADKGTGSIQMMTLLFSLAVIMSKTRSGYYSPLVLIEEPEQNVHPMLQSKLADLFQDFVKIINERSQVQLIIETHSEYLIRRTQVIVADQNYHDESDLQDNNPFKVIYFPSEDGQIPYDMKYHVSGTFSESFGSGFYDEASKLSFQVLSMQI